MGTLEEIQAKREALSTELRSAKDAQLAVDLEAVLELEMEHGFDRIIRIDIGCWKPGCGAPACIAVRIPTHSEKNCARFIDTINRSKEHSKERITASEQLGASCVVYPKPSSEEYKAAIELAPLILSHAAAQIVKATQGLAESEGKE